MVALPNVVDEKLTLLALAILSCAIAAGCDLAGRGWTPAPDVLFSRSGDVKVVHEPLGANRHRVTVSAETGLDETEGSVVLRLGITASRFAHVVCPGSVDFSLGFYPDSPVSTRFTERSKQFEFSCD